MEEYSNGNSEIEDLLTRFKNLSNGDQKLFLKLLNNYQKSHSKK